MRAQDYPISKSALIITILFNIKFLLTNCLNLNKYFTSVNLGFHVYGIRDHDLLHSIVYESYLSSEVIFAAVERSLNLSQSTAQQYQS